MKLAILLVCVFVSSLNHVNAGVYLHDEFYCLTTDPIRPQNSMFATQSGYEPVRGRRIDPSVSSCTPSRFWFASRHGGRNPPPEIINQMRDFASGPFRDNIIRDHEEGRTTFCLDDVENLRNWQQNMNLTIENESLLTVIGWDTMLGIAHRFQAAFPSLLPLTYNANNIRFRHTDRQRSQGSIRAFADGLYGSNAWQRVEFDAVPERDTLLRPQNFCPAYDAISNVTTEQVAFEEGPEYQQMLVQVNTKLGLFGNLQLSSQQIRSMWEWCRWEQTSQPNEPAAWCAPFSLANNQVLDFWDDFEFFYQQGYGLSNRRLAENLNCELVQDLLRYLQSNEVSDQRARIYGTHSSTLQLFLVSMGFFEDDEPMTRHNFAQQTLRLWRTGFITPKGANLAVIRYDCPGGDNDALFLWNERPLQIPGCDHNGLCKVSTVIARYNRFLNANCNNLFCSSD